MYCWLPMTRRRPPPQSWARPAQDGERRINVILNHKATVLFPKRHNVTETFISSHFCRGTSYIIFTIVRFKKL
jgi:hypothetical protein